jgi:hypothetical protein
LSKRKIKQEEPILLSEQKVKDVVFSFLEFSKSMGNMSGMYPSGMNTLLLNQRMQDISMNPAGEVTQERLDRALGDVKNSEIDLQAIGQYFENTSSVYKRLLSYLNSMLSFDLTMSCTNAQKEDYGTKEYKKDMKIAEDFLDMFDYQKEFSIAVKELLRNELFVCSPRFDSDKYVLQELPSSPQYTKITGRWSHGLLFSISMLFFILPGIDLDLFDPFFKRAYRELWGNGKPPEYIPSLSPETRGSSSWTYWRDVPVSVGWAFKMSPEIATRIPYFSSLFQDIYLIPLVRNLQKNINMSSAARMISGSVPFLNNASAKVSDQLAISGDTLAKFLQLVSSALSSAIKVIAAPLNDIKPISFPSDNAMYPEYIKTALASSGINTNLIFTSDIKPNQLESQLSLNVDEQLMTALYPQFNAFLNYNINKRTKRFKWDFRLEGTNFFTNRAERLERQTTLLQNGIVLPQKIAAAIGMRPQDFRRQMEEAKANGWADDLIPILQAAQIPSDGGRPSLSSNKLSEAGASSQESGDNKVSSIKTKKK